jgi:peptidoglycan-associated lipoprotein
LIVQGNCDERGTEKYNLALGERRALAVREYLANLGMNPDQIKTVTFGKSKPADPGHNEEAWKKNRRGDLVLVTPK